MKEDYYKKVEKMFYNYKKIDNKIEEILNKNSDKTDINSYIKTNYKTSREELEVINKLDNLEIKRLLKEKYVVDRTLDKYENDYRANIIKRRYFTYSALCDNFIGKRYICFGICNLCSKLLHHIITYGVKVIA